jgi:hypothetical protein
MIVRNVLALIVTRRIEFLTLTSSQVLILIHLYGIMSKHIGFVAAAEMAGVKQ